MKYNGKLKQWLYSRYTDVIPDELKVLLKDQNIPDNWIKPTTVIIHRLSTMPWYTQKELLSDTDLSKDELVKLNNIIRESDVLQDIILNKGLGRKYWNTIIPLLNTGSVDNVLENKYNFPLRLGIYPGISCMFYCGFCGRNQQARYKSDIQGESLEMFKTIFKSMPKTSTISISGGLEPLTHSKIGEIISIAKSYGIRVPLITNANNLTNKFIEKQKGILELDSLRVSLYGIDEESTYLLTRKKRCI